MIVKKKLRRKRLSDHVLTEELKFLLHNLEIHRQIDTIAFARLLREGGKVFVGLRSERSQKGFGSEIISEKDLSYLRRRYKFKTFKEII